MRFYVIQECVSYILNIALVYDIHPGDVITDEQAVELNKYNFTFRNEPIHPKLVKYIIDILDK